MFSSPEKVLRKASGAEKDENRLVVVLNLLLVDATDRKEEIVLVI